MLWDMIDIYLLLYYYLTSMNLLLTQPNLKGQIVIPKSLRDALGIDQHTPLAISRQGDGVFLAPIHDIITTKRTSSTYQTLLTQTRGAWGTELSDEKRTLEYKASIRRKKLW